MRILLTNDDGITAPGLALVAAWAKSLGEVTVVAPKREQSGRSQAIDFINPVEIKRVDFMAGVEAWAMDSTPADCVRFGTEGLGRSYDLLLSGLNRGENLGFDIVYSGTVGAVYEGAMHGIPSVGLSTFRDTQVEAARHFDALWAFVTAHGLTDRCLAWNINLPAEPKGFRITRQGKTYFSDSFEKRGEDLYIQLGEPVPSRDPDDLTEDISALRAGYASLTPLSVTRTDEAVLRGLLGP